jgi:50S ribosomal subunit-associated GTPase HflX
MIICANKFDLVNQEHFDMALKEISRHFLGVAILGISAFTGTGVERLMEQLASELRTIPIQASAA